MKLQTRIFRFCLALLFVVGVILPAFSVTTYAEVQYTWEIPLKLTVKEGGSAAAQALDFEIELYDLSGEKIDLVGFGGEFLNPSPYVQTSGIGEYTATLRFQGGEELRLHLQDGFMVKLKDSDEDGWVYDEREYEVNAWFDGAGNMAELSIIDCDSGDSKDAAAFECTYTGWYLHFETNGGGGIGAVSASDGSTIYLSGYTPTRDGYTFNGWYSDTALQTTVTSVRLEEETWVYAGWVANEPVTVDYTLYFDTDGGSAIDSVTKAEGTEIDLSVYTPTKDGYTFDGWYSDSTLQTEVTNVTLNQNKTVYAGWTKNTVYYSLTFDTGGGSAIGSVTMAEGTEIDLSDYTPTRDGYTFDGWYSDSTLQTKVTSVTLNQDKTVYAGWTYNPASYSLTFDTDGGSMIDSVSATEGTVINLSAYTPTRTDYIFTGWYAESTWETLITEIALDTNRTVYAGWSAITEAEIVIQELTAVPDGLNSLYSSVDALISDLISRITAATGYTEENALVYDVVLQYSTDGGITWITATEDNFPVGGITVTLPYPDGTDSTYDFAVLHMFTETSTRLGITAGETESPTVTKTDDGLVFTLTGLSPVAISWQAPITTITTTTSPATGDNGQIALWLGLMVVSGIGIVGLTAYSIKRRRFS